MKEITEIIKIPKERIAVLIGKEGITKKKIQKDFKVKLKIDSEEGEVMISRPVHAKDPILALKSLDVVKAIARGFTPQKAFKLKKTDYYFELVDLSEFVSDKSLIRIRSRLIGREGKSRSFITKLTGADIVIYGKTVALIGDEESVGLAKQAVMKIIRGLTHNTVFKFLERRQYNGWYS